MKVREIMSGRVATCDSHAKIAEVAKLMRDNDCGAIPIVDNGQLRGIITDRDIVVRGIAEGKNVMDMDASTCMSNKVASISADSNVEECTNLMERNQVRRIVVTDKDNKVMGIVAQADVALHAPARETGDTVKKVSK